MIKVLRADLLKAAKLAMTIIEPKSTIPVLAMLGISAKDGVVTVAYKGLDGFVSRQFDGDGDDLAESLVNAKRLMNALAAMTSETVSLLRLNDGRLQVASGDRGTVLRMMTTPGADAPEGFKDLAAPTFRVTLPMGVLHSMIEGVGFCVSTEETRYYLNGVGFGIEGEVLTAVATDGHRLMMRRHSMVGGSSEGEIAARLIVPRLALPAIKAMDKAESDVVLSFHPLRANGATCIVQVTTAHAVLRYKLIDGTYPDINRVIPQGLTAFVEVDARELARGCTILAHASSESSRPVLMAASDGLLGLRMVGPDIGLASDKKKAVDDEATATIRASVSGEPPEGPAACYNARYLKDMSASFGGKIRFFMNGRGGPAILTSAAGEAAGFGVLMPMRGTDYDWRPAPLAA